MSDMAVLGASQHSHIVRCELQGLFIHKWASVAAHVSRILACTTTSRSHTVAYTKRAAH